MNEVVDLGPPALAAAQPVAVPANAELVVLEQHIEVPADDVWDAVRDVYAVHTRLVPGLVTRVERDGDVRIVTFADGAVVNERIVSVNDHARRVEYGAFGGASTFHAASMEVIPDGSRASRFVWRTSFLPETLRPMIQANMQIGARVMKAHLEATART